MLVIDDSEFDRRRLHRLAGDFPVPVRFVETAGLAELGPALDSDVYDVILLDYHLADGDGVDALHQIREHGKNGQCPVIILTGDDTSEVAVKALKTGADDYIAKERLIAADLKRRIDAAIQSRADLALETVGARISQAQIQRYTDILQPKLASVIRDLRKARGALEGKEHCAPDDLKNIERQCIQMWAALLDPDDAARTQEFHH